MGFIRSIINSIYSPEFYKDVSQKSVWSAIRYFLLFTFILALFQTAVMAGPLISSSQNIVSTFITDITNYYPNELEINIQNGVVSTNVKEPYFVAFPHITNNPTENKVKNILVVDTATPFSAGAFNNYQTLVWLAKDTLFYKDQSSEKISAYDLSKITSFRVDKFIIQNVLNTFKPYLKFVGPVLSVLLLLGIYSLYNLRLFFALILALLIFVIAKIFSKSLNYPQSYKLGLYAMTLPLIVEVVLTTTEKWTHLGSFPFMVTILAVVIVFTNLGNLEVQKDKNLPPVPPAT